MSSKTTRGERDRERDREGEREADLQGFHHISQHKCYIIG